MLTTTCTTARRGDSCTAAPAASADALAVAIDDARTRLDGALADLNALMAAGQLGAEEARALDAEYVEAYLVRLAALEELGPRACTPDEWQHYETRAQERARTARRSSAKARRERLRDALRARQCLVVAPGRLAGPLLAALVADEPDGEILEIRAELAAAQLL